MTYVLNFSVLIVSYCLKLNMYLLIKIFRKHQRRETHTLCTILNLLVQLFLKKVQDNLFCISLDLLRVSTSLLTSILPIELESFTSFSFLSHVFCSNLAQILHSCCAFANIFKHLQASSNSITVTHQVNF